MQNNTDLCELLLLQLPLLDAVVSRAAEQHVSLHGQTFNAVIVRRLKVMSGTHITQSSFCHIKYLERKKRNKHYFVHLDC